MEITEIVLLVAGGIIFILSFLIPDKKGEVSEQSKEMVKEEIADMVSREMESVRGHVDGVVEEAVTYAMEKTERSLERLSNEKIMAVNEYSDTVLAEIHKNHEEAMFLYDMLNSKHVNLKDTVSAINRTVKEAEETVSSLREMTNTSAVPQVGAAEKNAERSVAQPVRIQEFRPGVAQRTAAASTARTVNTAPSAQNTVQQTVRTVSAAPSALERLAAAQSTGRTVSAVPTTPIAAAPATAQSAARTVSAVSTIPVSAAPTPVPVVSTAAGRVSFLQENAVDGQNNNERILELYRQGKSKVAIAKELGLGVGEVKLVIDLFRNQ